MQDPYIGMPIMIGSGKPPHRPEMPPQKPEMPPQRPEMPPQRPEMPPVQSGSGFDARLLGSLPLAIAYTPMQQWKTTYSPSAALDAGTIFPELDLPFEGRTIR